MSDEPEPDQEDGGGLSFGQVGTLIEAGLVLLAFPLGWLLSAPPLATLTWDWPGLLWGLAATVPMLAAFFVLVHFPGPIFAPLTRFTEEVMVPLLRTCTPVELVALALLAGLGEEMLFRGVLQAFLTQSTSLWLGVLLTSVLFGLMHAVNLAYFLLTVLIGVYLGLLWVWTGNLLAPIVAHALYDLVALFYLTRRGSPD